MAIAQTPFFTPRPGLNLAQALLDWSLSDDLSIEYRGDGQVALVAKGGAEQWPCEWTPAGDEVVVSFDFTYFWKCVALSAPQKNALGWPASGDNSGHEIFDELDYTGQPQQSF